MIHVIGVGGTGGWLIPALVKMVPSSAIHIWDGDDVEEKNIARQNYARFEIGDSKVEAMADRYQIGIESSKYMGDDEALDIRSGDTVIICADNYHVRAVIDERAVVLPHITVINCGNEETQTTTQIYVKRDDMEFTPRISYMHSEIKRGQTAQELACAEVANLPGGEQTVAANMLSAAMALMAFVLIQKWDSSPLRPDSRTRIPWHDFYTDMMRGTAEHIDWRIEGVGDWETSNASDEKR